MAYPSLILGMVFSMGLFAAKGGMGMAFGTLGTRVRFKALGMSAFALAYALVFLATGLVLRHPDILAHLDEIQNLLQSGMLIHGIMAILMSAWGLVLLKKTSHAEKQSRGWLLLVVPCPVCAASILFSAAFFLSLFPDRHLSTIIVLYLFFVMTSLIVMVMTKTRPGGNRSPESLLGGTMLLIAAYFIISVTVMPHVGELDSVYRLARYRSTTPWPDIVPTLLTGISLTLAFGWGWWMNTTDELIKRRRIWDFLRRHRYSTSRRRS
ncbi:MAG: DUF2162 domain-containing protein [Proteobacteria bacterium]|nr:DUF2162 domain-containing protein [Pseudomonadota bacterium]